MCIKKLRTFAGRMWEGRFYENRPKTISFQTSTMTVIRKELHVCEILDLVFKYRLRYLS